MKKSLFVLAAGLLALSTAACDSTTNLCIEEYNCATSSTGWCSHGYDDPAECENMFYDRYDYCLDMANKSNTSNTLCNDLYSRLNDCIWSHTTCTNSFEGYQNKMNDIIYYQCSSEAEEYVDTCGLRFEDLYQF